MHRLLILLILSFHQWANGSTQDIDKLGWALKKEDRGIEIYSAEVPDSKHRAILSITTLDADIETIVNIIRTPSTCTQWVYRCNESYLYEQKTPQEDIVYTANKMPFPAQDRNILAHIKWETDPKTNVVRAIGKAIHHDLPKNKNYIRIENAKMFWEFTPLATGKTKVRSYAHVDPAGRLPAWLTNQLAINIPLKTMEGLKKIVKKQETSKDL